MLYIKTFIIVYSPFMFKIKICLKKKQSQFKSHESNLFINLFLFIESLNYFCIVRMYIAIIVSINAKLPCPFGFFETQKEFVVSRDVNMTLLIPLYTPLQSEPTFIRPDLTYLIIRVNIVILGVSNFCI